MNPIVTKARYTPEDLLAMPDGDRYELVNGELVERHMGSESSYIGGRLFWLLFDHCEKNKLGWVWPADTGYQCFPEERNRVRKPDVSFVGRGRLPNDRPAQGYERVVPDLVVEVISPNDLAYEVDEKIEDFLRVGVKLVWVVNPETRTVRVHRPDGSDTRLHEDDELSGEDVVPGFHCRVRDLFPPAVQTGSQTPMSSSGLPS